jgi:hypothetical protein
MGAMGWRVLQALAAVVVMGCGSEGWEAPAPESSSDGRVTNFGANLNGSNLNGSNLNGSNLNGSNLNGANLNGSNLNGSALDGMLVSVDYAGARRGAKGAALDGVWLKGSMLQGALGRQTLSGFDFTGVQLTGNLGSGQQVALRVDGVQQGSGADADVWSYRVSYLNPSDERWYPICHTAEGAPAGAIPVQGRWDYRQGVPGGGARLDDAAAFTFGCEGAAIAKCVRFGYKPWASVKGVSLAEHHQACTRLVRADYCGDGTSYTVDGQWVNLYDAAGVQEDTEHWLSEAEWDADGARCFSPHTRARRQVQCAEGRKMAVCGSRQAFRHGALLMSEVPPGTRSRGPHDTQ